MTLFYVLIENSVFTFWGTGSTYQLTDNYFFVPLLFQLLLQFLQEQSIACIAANIFR